MDNRTGSSYFIDYRENGSECILLDKSGTIVVTCGTNKFTRASGN